MASGLHPRQKQVRRETSGFSLLAFALADEHIYLGYAAATTVPTVIGDIRTQFFSSDMK